MATKNASKGPTERKASTKRASSGGTTRSAGASKPMGGGAANPFAGMQDAVQLQQFKEMMTPEQAFELYRQNARLALEIIDAAVESTAKMRKLQFEGEEEARNFHKRAARKVAEAENPEALMATGQNTAQEGLQKAMLYWSQMFDLVVEMQKRLFTVIEEQMQDVPGVKQAKAAMAMMPDLSQTKNLVNAMQGVLSSGGSAFESMQKVMGDFTKMAQQTMPGMKR